jgi:hypothetical protein
MAVVAEAGGGAADRLAVAAMTRLAAAAVAVEEAVVAVEVATERVMEFFWCGWIGWLQWNVRSCVGSSLL